MTLDTQQTRHMLTGVAEYDAANESASDVRALSAALRFLGEDADLSTVLAVSGEAFRSAVHAERWSIGSAYVSREPVLAAGARAFGYQARYLIGASIDETWIAIRDAVDAGQPVLSSGILARDGEPLSTWWFLVRGYDAQGKMVEVAGLPGSVDRYTPLPALHGRQATWAGVVKGLSVAPALLAERPVFLIGLRGQPPQPRDVVLETIQRAVRMAQDATITVQTEMPQAAGRYVMGLSSYQVWASHLGGITGREPFFRCGPFEGAMPAVDVARANEESAERIRRGRRAAADYFRRVSDLFDGAAHDALLSAAAGYAEVADLAEEYREQFTGPTPLAEQDLLMDRDNRAQGVLLIRQMQALEGATMSQLESALRRIADGP